MLSRIAESLYWIGRYVERADGTGRILDAHVHGSLFGTDPATIDATSRRLLQVMGVTTPQHFLTSRDVMELLAYDQNQATSILASMYSARENARGVREVISLDMWEGINSTYNRLPGYRSQARRRGPDAFLGYVRVQCALINGYIDATLVRDDGWRFVVLGRSLERVDMTTRMLEAELVRGPEEADWPLLLRYCGGHEAFLRSHQGRLSPVDVVQFLVSDRLFPRSLLHSIELAGEVLEDLEPTTGSGDRGGRARRALGAAHAKAAYTEPDELVSELPEVLNDVQELLAQAHTALSERFFRQLTAVQWSAEESR